MSFPPIRRAGERPPPGQGLLNSDDPTEQDATCALAGESVAAGLLGSQRFGHYNMERQTEGAISETRGTKRQKPPNVRQPTKAEMEEIIVIHATLDQLAGAVLAGGAPRREPENPAAAK